MPVQVRVGWRVKAGVGAGADGGCGGAFAQAGVAVGERWPNR